MKKNIWENVYYRLKDPVEIKLAVLYVLFYADIPVSDVELKHCMLEATSVDFLSLCDVIQMLLEENHMKQVWRDEMDKYVLTSSGEDMVSIQGRDMSLDLYLCVVPPSLLRQTLWRFYLF